MRKHTLAASSLLQIIILIGFCILFTGCQASQTTMSTMESEWDLDEQLQPGESSMISEDSTTPVYGDILCPSEESIYFESNTERRELEIEKMSETDNSYITGEDWYTDNHLHLPYLRGTEFDIINDDYLKDNEYKAYMDKVSLNADKSFYDEDYIYGVRSGKKRQLMLLDIFNIETGELKWELDFSSYIYGSEEREISWATIKDRILYVSIRNLGYAEPNSSYITAVNLDTLEVIWKSDSQVSNAENFIVCNDVIVCAYGFTEEDDYIYQLDMTTGKTIGKKLIKTQAYYLVVVNNCLYVRCYNTDYTFNIPSGTNITMSAVYPVDHLQISLPINYLKDFNERECLIAEGTTRYRMVVVNATNGRRTYALQKSTDGGKTWIIKNNLPFEDMMGDGIDVYFMDEDMGFAELVVQGGAAAILYVTEDGGESFEPVKIGVDYVTLDDGTIIYPYDYPLLPVYKDEDRIYMVCGQGIDGDYDGGDENRLEVYVSEDNGKTFESIGSKKVN